MSVLRLFNRTIIVLALAATIIGSGICVFTWALAADTSGQTHLDDTITATQLGFVVLLIALGANALLVRSHSALWAGEATLALAVIASLVYGLVIR